MIDSQIRNPSEYSVATDANILPTRVPGYKVPSLPFIFDSCPLVYDYTYLGSNASQLLNGRISEVQRDALGAEKGHLLGDHVDLRLREDAPASFPKGTS